MNGILHLQQLLPLAQTSASTESQISIMEMVEHAGWVLVPLVLLSVMVVAIVVFCFFWLRRATIAGDAFLTRVDRLIEDGNLEGLILSCEESNNAVSRVIGRTVLFARNNPRVDIEGLEKVAEAEGQRQAARINMPVALLMDLGVMAPLVGLLGTVVGILRSFGTIAGDATPMRTMLLAGGVSQALVATAFGLTVGLVAMLFYSLFRQRVTSLVTYYDSLLTELLVRVFHCLASGRK